MKKIYISQGHEKGIGLEVFFKTTLLLSQDELDKLHFFAFRDAIKDTLSSLKLPFELLNSAIKIGIKKIPTTFIDETDFSQTFTSLKLAMDHAQRNGILYTLPTSKDQFPTGAGHTEYFRKFYKTPELGMFFSGPSAQVLLITDHLPLKSLSKKISTNHLKQTIDMALQTLLKWRWPISRILISGLNPHAGENGLIGDEDCRVSEAISQLKKIYPFEFLGPLPGDTMYNLKQTKSDLLVYLYHDQGLGVFKSTEGFIGSNITLGLTYPRFSPDHGTSFSLYGKNTADYRGCYYSLKEALELLKGLDHGQNSNHQS